MKSQEFLVALSAKNYENALALAREILLLDPKNELFIEYQTVLIEKIQLAGNSNSSNTSSDSNSSDDESSKSSNSTN
jgi:hypothetical protein